MLRIDRERALFLGLCALQDYVDQAARTPLRGTIHLRALLALLALQGAEKTDAYRLFWSISCNRQEGRYGSPEDYIRGTLTQTQWIRIARDLGFPAVRMDFVGRVNEVVRKARDRLP